MRDPKPVTPMSPGPLSYIPICDPHFCRIPPLKAGKGSHERTRVPAMAEHLRTCLLNSMDHSSGCISLVEARYRPQNVKKHTRKKANLATQNLSGPADLVVTGFGSRKALISSFQNRIPWLLASLAR